VLWAWLRALLKAGSSMPARMAMMAMTTNSSINVNGREWDIVFFFIGGSLIDGEILPP
jgi:hypothetical protein